LATRPPKHDDSNATLGAALAAEFSDDQTASSPDHCVVLMKKYGFTTLGMNIPETVFRALYALTNAQVLTNVLLLRNAVWPENAEGTQKDMGSLGMLSEQEGEGL
jgi:Class II Aldolase and Adducin N-terminal domain